MQSSRRVQKIPIEEDAQEIPTEGKTQNQPIPI